MQIQYIGLLHLPSVPYPIVGNTILVYIMNTGIVLALIVGFYWFRYGGTLLHDNKPEWDTIPAIVKKDIFFARATVDDLPALKAVWKKKPNELLEKTDEENKQAIAAIIGKMIRMEIRFCVLKGLPMVLLSRNLPIFLCSSGKAICISFLNRHTPV